VTVVLTVVVVVGGAGTVTVTVSTGTGVSVGALIIAPVVLEEFFTIVVVTVFVTVNVFGDLPT
jgi:hypothetical protein